MSLSLSSGGSGTNSGLTSNGVSPSPSMSAFGSVGNMGIAGPPGASGGPPGAGGAGGGGDSGAYDPMAALMAPPSRRMPSSYSTPSLHTSSNSNSEALDPLAAMMAPPSSRYSMPHSSSAMNMASAAPMPQINVWKPPAVSASAAPVALPPVVYDDADAGTGSSTGGEGPPMGAMAPPPM